MQIKTVTVIGANGNMGRNISAIFASFGNAKVYMVARDMEKAKEAVQSAYRTVRADSIIKNCIPADYSMLEACIKDSSLIFETIKEDFTVKQQMNELISRYMSEHAVCVSGTSGLSVTRLAEAFSEAQRKRYFGMHLFNPPYQMTLCELIATKYSSSEIIKEIEIYLSKTLYRTTVVVKDSPAFLGNRIGFQFINEALQYAEHYKKEGGIGYIDEILGGFTGRTMPPLATADFVGLDIHKAIVANLYENINDYANETFKLPKFVEKLVEKKWNGKKSGQGLYKTEILENKTKIRKIYNIDLDEYHKNIEFDMPFKKHMISHLKEGDYNLAFSDLIYNTSKEAMLCLEFLLKYIIYSLNTVSELELSPHDADKVMASGFSWCPPLGLYQVISNVCDVKKLIEERVENEIIKRIDIDELLWNIPECHFDYRRYLRAI